MKETLKKGGYTKAISIGNKQVILIDTTGKKELWFCSKNHAGYSIKYKNTDLEFARSL